MKEILDKISELEQRIVELKAEVEKEEKENKSTNKRWRAECAEGYWAVTDYGMPDWSYNYNRDMDSFRYDTHNQFQIIDEARRYAKVLEIERQLKRFADEHNGEIDWSNINQEKWRLYYNYKSYKTDIIPIYITKDARVIYFSSSEIAQRAIDTIGTDKIKEYLTYEW